MAHHPPLSYLGTFPYQLVSHYQKPRSSRKRRTHNMWLCRAVHSAYFQHGSFEAQERIEAFIVELTGFASINFPAKPMSFYR